MDPFRLDDRQSRSLTLLLIATLAATGWFLRPYLGAAVFAAVLAVVFVPLYDRIAALLGGRTGLALIGTYLAVLMSVLLPLALVAVLASRVVTDVLVRSQGTGLTDQLTLGGVLAHANVLLAKVPGMHLSISQADLIGAVQDAVQRTGADRLRATGSGLVALVPAAFITVSTFGLVITRYRAIVEGLQRLSPFPRQMNSLYLRRLRAMTVSMVRGTFVIAALQGVMTAVFMEIAGVRYAAFIGLLAAVLAAFPLGAGLIVVPVGAALILSGNVWQGVLQIVAFLLLTSNTDNLLRPRFVSSEAALHPALTLLGIFAGVAAFGAPGIVYGPVIMIFAATTVELAAAASGMARAGSEG